jgi:hypothetical protein
MIFSIGLIRPRGTEAPTLELDIPEIKDRSRVVAEWRAILKSRERREGSRLLGLPIDTAGILSPAVSLVVWPSAPSRTDVTGRTAS